MFNRNVNFPERSRVMCCGRMTALDKSVLERGLSPVPQC
ncbi:MAG: hypothetical protein K0R45_3081 [Pseudomonas sp.]|jgi:hypothetical protein|nr:hypothetical protein [Pseudomonas sp.]